MTKILFLGEFNLISILINDNEEKPSFKNAFSLI